MLHLKLHKNSLLYRCFLCCNLINLYTFHQNGNLNVKEKSLIVNDIWLALCIKCTGL